MKQIIYIVFITLITCLFIQGQDNKASVYVETPKFTSQTFNNTRTIRILLPPGYHEQKNKKTSYPVLYLNDGIMVFHAFKLEETVHRLINEKKVMPLIIVGIDNGGATDKTKNPVADRANEFLPYPDVGFAPDRLYEPNPPSPIGKLFPDFMVEVMSFIKEKYRIKSGTENTGIGGFSYGGVAALYIAMNKSNMFGKLLLESTPLWIGKDKQLLKDTQKAKKWSAKIYIGLGTNENPDEVINKEGKAEHDLLISSIRKNSPKSKIKNVLGEGDKHEPPAWSKRFPAALQFLFGN